MSPRSASPGSASTQSTVPRAMTRTSVMTPSGFTVPTNDTSRPLASAMAAAMTVRACGEIRLTS